MNKKNVIPFRSAYGTKVKCDFNTVGESMTQQQFSEESDIHNIIRRYDTDGVIMAVRKGTAEYSDFSQVTDWYEALQLIDNAKENFLEIPSNIRKQFDNDPAKFYNFAKDPDNFDKLLDMGLATRRVSSSSVVEENKESVEVKKTETDSQHNST